VHRRQNHRNFISIVPQILRKNFSAKKNKKQKKDTKKNCKKMKKKQQQKKHAKTTEFYIYQLFFCAQKKICRSVAFFGDSVHFYINCTQNSLKKSTMLFSSASFCKTFISRINMIKFSKFKIITKIQTFLYPLIKIYNFIFQN